MNLFYKIARNNLPLPRRQRRWGTWHQAIVPRRPSDFDNSWQGLDMFNKASMYDNKECIVLAKDSSYITLSYEAY